MVFLISRFVSNTLGPRFIQPQILDLKSIVTNSRNITPLLFLLSPGLDTLLLLTQQAKDFKMEDKFEPLSLGQGKSVLSQKKCLKETW